MKERNEIKKVDTPEMQREVFTPPSIPPAPPEFINKVLSNSGMLQDLTAMFKESGIFDKLKSPLSRNNYAITQKKSFTHIFPSMCVVTKCVVHAPDMEQAFEIITSVNGDEIHRSKVTTNKSVMSSDMQLREGDVITIVPSIDNDNILICIEVAQ